MVIDIGTKDSTLTLSEANYAIDGIVNEFMFNSTIDEHISLLEADEEKRSFKESAKMFLAKMKEKIIQICNTVVNAIRKAYATILYKSAEKQKKDINFRNLPNEIVDKIFNNVMSSSIYYSYEKIRNTKNDSKLVSVDDYLNIARLSDKEKLEIISKERYTLNNDIGQHMRDNIALCNKLRDENLAKLKQYSSSITSEEYTIIAKNMFNQYSAAMKAIVNNAKVDTEIIKRFVVASKQDYEVKAPTETENISSDTKLSSKDISNWFKDNGVYGSNSSLVGLVLYPAYCNDKTLLALFGASEYDDKHIIIAVYDENNKNIVKKKVINFDKIDFVLKNKVIRQNGFVRVEA